MHNRITSSEVKVLNIITPDKMRKAQMEDKDLVEGIKYVDSACQGLHDMPDSGSLSHYWSGCICYNLID